MKTIDNEEVTVESIDDHFYKFDSPEVLERNLEPINPREDIATAFTLARPILVAMTATPLIPERWQGGHRHPRLGAGWGGAGWLGGGVGRGICRFAEVWRS